MSQLLTTAAVAKALGLTRQAVGWRISHGHLKATRLGNMWLIDARDLKTHNLRRARLRRRQKARR